MNLILNNNIDELGRLMMAVEEFCDLNKLSIKDAMNISLVLEEVFSNIVFYAFNDKNTHEIEIDISIEDKEVMIIVDDDGEEFNILEKPEPDDLQKPVEERNVGGLGIHFVKKLMDDIEYKRAGDRNILQMKKLIE